MNWQAIKTVRELISKEDPSEKARMSLNLLRKVLGRPSFARSLILCGVTRSRSR
jgi:hypothetical protein